MTFQTPPQVVYHWWAHESDPHQHCKNLRSPIIPAIATLRAKNPTIEIHVLDGTENDAYNDPIIGSKTLAPYNTRNPEAHYSERWGNWPVKLGFTVWHNKFALQNQYKDKAGYKHLSRLFDLHKLPELFELLNYYGEMDDDGYDTYAPIKNPMVIYTDADVFWFKDPLPLDKKGSRFAFDGWNSGFFYYQQGSPEVERFFEIFKAYTVSALNSLDVREIMKSFVGYTDWYYVFDEMILSYMFRNNRGLFDQLALFEHCTARQLGMASPDLLKMFHANGSMFHNHLAKSAGEREHCRGLIPLIWKELWDGLKTVMSDNDIAQIYTLQELDYYLPRQYSFTSLEGWRKIRMCGNGKDHYFLHETLSPTIGMV